MFRFVSRAFALVLACFAVAHAARAHEYKIGDLVINHPWSRATPGGAKVAGGFMTITNSGTSADRLVSASLEIARTVEIHEMAMNGNVMTMRALEKGLEIKPGETVTLKPGSFHVMFIDIARPLKEDEKIKGELVFEKAGRIAVEFKVENRAGTGEHGAGHGSHHTPPKAP